MKQVFNFCLLLFWSLTPAIGQILPTDEAYYSKYRSPFQSLYATIDLATSTGTGLWGADNRSGEAYNRVFNGNDGWGVGPGFSLAFSQLVPINMKLDHGNSFSSGIRWGAEVVMHGNARDERSGYDRIVDQAANLSFLLGYALSYNFDNRFMLEGGMDVHLPMWSSRPEVSLYYFDNSFESLGSIIVSPAESASGEGSSWRPGVGYQLALRTRKLRLFMKYHIQPVKQYYEAIEYDGDADEISVEGFNAEFRITTLRFGIGFLFGQV